MRLALILSLIIALLAVVFALQNPGEMVINLPFTDLQLESTQPVVLISTLLIGLMIGVLASLPGRIGAGLRARKAEKQLEEISKSTPTAKPVESSTPTQKAQPVQTSSEADETQQLADEVTKRTAQAQEQHPPPLDP